MAPEIDRALFLQWVTEVAGQGVTGVTRRSNAPVRYRSDLYDNNETD